MQIAHTLFIFKFVLFPLLRIHAFSTPIPTSKGYYDRFRATCPSDTNCIHQFNPTLLKDIEDTNDDVTWVAVYRSSNNLPSVFLKDDFLNAMDIATSTAIMGGKGFDKSKSNKSKIETKEGKDIIGENTGKEGVVANTPVAVGRLRPAGKKWIIDNLRCSLKKEDTNELCEGGSEHTEALSICIDELILAHLTRQNQLQEDDERNELNLFEDALRCKATLVAAPLFEARGFSEVKTLSKDMATHTSTLDASMERYASRVADIGNKDVVAKSPGARDRALQILSLLGKLDSEREKQSASNLKDASEDEEEYDPFAGFRRY